MEYIYSLLGIGIGVYMIDKIWGNNTIWQKVVLLSSIIAVMLSFDFLGSTLVLLKAIEGIEIAIQFWVEDRLVYIILVTLYIVSMLGVSVTAWVYCRTNAAKEIFYDNINEFIKQLREQFGLIVNEYKYSFEENRTVFVIGVKVAQLSVENDLNCFIKQYEARAKLIGAEVYLYEENDDLVEIYITKHIRVKRKIKMIEIILYWFNSCNKSVWGR